MYTDAREIFIEAELSKLNGKVSRLEKKYGLPKETIDIWVNNIVTRENVTPSSNAIMDKGLTGGKTCTARKIYRELDKLDRAWDKASHESLRKAFIALEIADNKTEEALTMKYGMGMPIIEQWTRHEAREMLDVLVSVLASTSGNQAKMEVGDIIDKTKSGLDRLDAEWCAAMHEFEYKDVTCASFDITDMKGVHERYGEGGRAGQ